MLRKIIATTSAPAAVGPYSQAVQLGQTLYMSGQIGLNPATMQMAGPDVESQAEQVLINMAAVLKAAGSDMSKVVKTTVLLADMNDFARVNAIYAKHFSEPFPARACYQAAGLPKQALVEIEAVAAVGDVKDE
ncbi:hypothetical protein BOX15_Mlig005196g1 [Macrostomum lignano]|uniref:Uncharacterized protein n=3 Tax=Macrostomum lignano TaxID=282301 RepID=A0A267DGQ1_9PLAT|nr:hypothetical protein BOX15_Mlig005196g1 [Macrostomum lignano]